MKQIFNTCILFGVMAFAQVKISDIDLSAEEISVAPSTILELESNKGGLLLPRLTQEQIKAMSPTPGMLVYCTNYNAILVYNGRAWAIVQGEELFSPNASPVNPNGSSVQDKSYITSTYVRPEFYELDGRVSQNLILENNDLIYFVAQPYWSGDLHYEMPDNTLRDNNGVFLNEYMGREGVISFSGNSEGTNAGDGLLNRSDSGYDKFSFGTWINLDEWTPGAKIFQKNHWNQERVSLILGDLPGNLIFKLNNKTIEFTTDIAINTWKFIGITYDGKGENKFSVYVDGKPVSSIQVPNDFPQELEFSRGATYLAKGLKGKLDNTFFSQMPLGKWQFDFYMKDMVNLRKAKWFMVKTLAYWRYNTAETYKQDEQSWRTMLREIREKIQQSGRDIKIRLGIHNSEKDTWKTMMANDKSREHFSDVLKSTVQNNNWDGVDFDFEWCYTQKEIDDFSKGVISTGRKLSELEGKIFSISLHPFTNYRISKEAIDAISFVSLQIYGPSGKNIMPWEVFAPSADKFVKHGFPKEKMVLGVPFYGSVKAGVPVMAYSDFVNDGLNNPALDEYHFKNQNYIFNGVNTIRRKAEYIRDNGFGGLMSWDISLDVAYDNPLSLQKAVNEVLGEPKNK